MYISSAEEMLAYIEREVSLLSTHQTKISSSKEPGAKATYTPEYFEVDQITEVLREARRTLRQ